MKRTVESRPAILFYAGGACLVVGCIIALVCAPREKCVRWEEHPCDELVCVEPSDRGCYRFKHLTTCRGECADLRLE